MLTINIGHLSHLQHFRDGVVFKSWTAVTHFVDKKKLTGNCLPTVGNWTVFHCFHNNTLYTFAEEHPPLVYSRTYTIVFKRYLEVDGRKISRGSYWKSITDNNAGLFNFIYT